ncbi:hydrogenase maturation protease [Saccharomonospora xinjiangensis]|uniref:hydrogenase maturation protease n=1 Tax=Saccharomonospora xinjiangensis TaxID=75294 RepID=UPI000A0639B5|nr:hydrogenase maturation protease [Saccharomonospora xinjiangensis]
MRPRVLVTGIGTILRGDEGFALEVVQRLAERRLPSWVQLADHGIGCGRLDCDMLGDYDTTVLVDGTPRGGTPGRLRVTDLDLTEAQPDGLIAPALLRLLGCDAARLVVVACEPRSTTGIGLSPEVAAAVDEAVELVTELVWGEPPGAAAAGSPRLVPSARGE